MSGFSDHGVLAATHTDVCEANAFAGAAESGGQHADGTLVEHGAVDPVKRNITSTGQARKTSCPGVVRAKKRFGLTRQVEVTSTQRESTAMPFYSAVEAPSLPEKDESPKHAASPTKKTPCVHTFIQTTQLSRHHSFTKGNEKRGLRRQAEEHSINTGVRDHPTQTHAGHCHQNKGASAKAAPVSVLAYQTVACVPRRTSFSSDALVSGVQHSKASAAFKLLSGNENTVPTLPRQLATALTAHYEMGLLRLPMKDMERVVAALCPGEDIKAIVKYLKHKAAQRSAAATSSPKGLRCEGENGTTPPTRHRNPKFGTSDNPKTPPSATDRETSPGKQGNGVSSRRRRVSQMPRDGGKKAVHSFNARFAGEVRGVFLMECAVACHSSRHRFYTSQTMGEREIGTAKSDDDLELVYKQAVAKVLFCTLGWGESEAAPYVPDVVAVLKDLLHGAPTHRSGDPQHIEQPALKDDDDGVAEGSFTSTTVPNDEVGVEGSCTDDSESEEETE